MSGMLMLVALVASKLEEPKPKLIDFKPDKKEKVKRTYKRKP